MKTVFITGITGQIGSYVAEEFIEDYKVYGLVRGASTSSKERLLSIQNKINFVQGDLTDFGCMAKILQTIKPDYIINLAAQSSVFTSYEEPLYTWDVTAKGFLNLLEATRLFCPESKLFQASSSEIFGDSYGIHYNELAMIEYYQSENTPLKPLNPYAVAKAAAHQLAIQYREKYGLDIACGIIYPNDSPRRHESFFTKKVVKYAGGLFKKYYKPGIQRLWIEDDEPKLKLGNLSSFRDFGHSQDVAKAIKLILENSSKEDYIIATGITRKVEDFVKEAFGVVGLDYKEFIEFDSMLYRKECPKDILPFPRKIQELGWVPQYDFRKLVKEMVDNELHS